MDHFILPPGVQHYIAVPYKSVEPYDNGDFYTYPERKGWTADDVEGKNDYGHRQPGEVEAFFQSWLFFGVLVEVFRIVNIHINTDDFIDHNKGLVTTRKLPDLMEEFAIAWKKKWPKDEDMHLRFKLETSPEAVATTEIVKTVFRVILPFCYDYTVGERPTVRSSLLSPEVVVSIMGLATTFFEAGKILYMEFGHRIPLGGGTPLLRSILREKWCPFHVTSMQMELRLDAQYYLAALPGLPENELKRHTKCTDTRCVEEPVDEDIYVLKHAVPGCSCQVVPIPIENLLDIIKQGDTPVIFFHNGDSDSNPRLELKGFNTTASILPYISISHVWSDGMGNPKRNALPTCVLESIQGMVNAVNFPGREPGHEHVGFWMDTLCIPVESKYDDQRKATIIKMRQIYQEASAVLALESQLQTVFSTVPLTERCVNFYATKWVRRLWTYQEGGLSSWLCIQFRDKSLELREIYKGFNMHALEHRGESMASQTQQSLANQFAANIRRQFGLVRSALSQWVKDDTINRLRWMACLPIFGSYSSRMTTRESDEPLCLASILHLDITPLVGVKSSDGRKSHDREIRKRADRELADERMAVLYSLIGKIQDFIIFNKYPRLPMEGFRWAPKTYLGRLPWSTDGEIEPSYKGRGKNTATITKAGLHVTFPFITFDYHFGLDITVGDKFFVHTVVEKPPGDSASSDDNDIVGQYLVELTKESEGFIWIAGASYRLVMQIPHEDRVVGKPSIAILGRLLPWNTDPRVRHECVVRATLLPLRYERSSDDLSIPTFVGMENPGCSMVIVKAQHRYSAVPVTESDSLNNDRKDDHDQAMLQVVSPLQIQSTSSLAYHEPGTRPITFVQHEDGGRITGNLHSPPQRVVELPPTYDTIGGS